MKPKRGGQPGNRNAYKHGFYSRSLTRQENADLAHPARGALQDEIVLFKVIISRVALLLKPGGHSRLSFSDTVLTLHVVSLAISRLNSFYRANSLLNPDQNDGVRELMRRLGFPETEIDKEISSATAAADPQAGESLSPRMGGFYASLFQPGEARHLEFFNKRELDDEIALLRILIKRTLKSLWRVRRYSPKYNDILHAYRVVIYAAACLERLERTRTFVFHDRRPPVSVLELALKEFWQEFEAKHPRRKGGQAADFSAN